jgi:hypothetical protein
MVDMRHPGLWQAWEQDAKVASKCRRGEALLF